MINIVVLSIISYLIGSIPFALTLSKIVSGKDVRTLGSGNQGATNVFRAGGFIPALLVFLLDFFKGYFALFLFSFYFDKTHIFIIFPAIFVVLGHIFSIFTKFKGGKGISTASGVIFFINPYIFCISFFSFWITFYFKRITSISSIIALFILLVSSFYIYYFNNFSINLLIISLILTVILLFSHRGNFKRLKNGNELKF